jgi:hypothetical protein
MLVAMTFLAYRHKVMLCVLMEPIINIPVSIGLLLIYDVMCFFSLVLITYITHIYSYFRVISRAPLIDYRITKSLNLLPIQFGVFHKVFWHRKSVTYLYAIIIIPLPFLNYPIIDDVLVFVKGNPNVLHEQLGLFNILFDTRQFCQFVQMRSEYKGCPFLY